MKVKRPRCHNCKFGGKQFKVADKTHLHCEHPQYTDEDFQSGGISPWDTLREFWKGAAFLHNKRTVVSYSMFL